MKKICFIDVKLGGKFIWREILICLYRNNFIPSCDSSEVIGVWGGALVGYREQSFLLRGLGNEVPKKILAFLCAI